MSGPSSTQQPGKKPSNGKGRSSAAELASAVLRAVKEMPLDFSDLDEKAAPASEKAVEQPAIPVVDDHVEVAAATQPETQSETSATEAEPTVNTSDNLPPLSTDEKRISALFDRVKSLLGSQRAAEEEAYYPPCPESLEDAGISPDDVERLILKFLFSKGSASGRGIALQIKLPFGLIDPILKLLKRDQLLMYSGSAEMGDYQYGITDFGRERARRYFEECTYFGAAPVPLRQYLKAMEAQSIAKQQATEENLRESFSDLLINEDMLNRLGPAINSGRGMFLFGEPGNGKTSIAERITKCFGSTIWIPRALGVEGEIIRVFDPGIHDEISAEQSTGLFDLSGVDPRWVQIVRPTVIAGGELTMAQLEVTLNPSTRICESPLQLKSNCGTLVIDDFGRQRMPVDELLNRWIVPLEKRYDFLNLPSGKKVQVPFDQLIIFSTNLEPKDLVDGAFLRRIPYKIQVVDPTVDEFKEIIRRIAPKMGFQYNPEAVEHLVQTHYLGVNRPFRSCQPRDLLLQVRNYCTYRCLPKVMTPEAFDFAVDNYFSVL